MKNKIAWLMLPALWMALCCLAGDVAAADRDEDKLSRADSRLIFRGKQGFSPPSIAWGADKHNVVLRFRRFPANAVELIGKQITDDSSRIFASARVMETETGAELRLQFNRPVKKVHRDKRSGGRTVLRFETRSNLPIAAPAYAHLVPEGFARLAYQDALDHMNGDDADCGAIKALWQSDLPWRFFAGLSTMDCQQVTGRHSRARDTALELIRDRQSPNAVKVLAALRLNEWPRQDPIGVRYTVSSEEKKLLAAPVLQELELRLSRYYLRKRTFEPSVSALFAAFGRGELDSALVPGAQVLRMRLAQVAVALGQNDLAVRLIDAMTLPASDSKAFVGTSRLASIALARAGRILESARISRAILDAEGVLVDPTLCETLFHSYAQAGLSLEAAMVSRNLTADRAFAQAAGNQRSFSQATSHILALSLLSLWQEKGPEEALRVSESTRHVEDPTGALSEARAALLLQAGDCDAVREIAERRHDREQLAFASLCYLSRGHSARAAELWTEDLQLGQSDPLVDAVREHTGRSAAFFNRMDSLGSVQLAGGSF